MLVRHYRAQTMTNAYFTSKQGMFVNKKLPSLNSITIQAGLYKVNSLMPEHVLIMSNISGTLPQTNFQLHGKRQKRTVSLSALAQKQQMYQFTDKFIHELVPHMQDLMTPKSKKTQDRTNTYTLRVRQKLTVVEDFEDLVENSMRDSHKGVYLPLSVNFKLSSPATSSTLETYLRMLRIPVSLFRRKKRPAFDDKVVFVGMEALYRQTSILKKRK